MFEHVGWDLGSVKSSKNVLQEETCLESDLVYLVIFSYCSATPPTAWRHWKVQSSCVDDAARGWCGKATPRFFPIRRIFILPQFRVLCRLLGRVLLEKFPA
jgi:hypothetical protein